jgi:hypothetical protein
MNMGKSIVVGICLSLFGTIGACGTQEEQVPPEAQPSISDVDGEPENGDAHGMPLDSVAIASDVAADAADSEAIRDAQPGADAIQVLDTGEGSGELASEDDTDLPDAADSLSDLNDVQDVGPDACVEDVVPIRGTACGCPERSFRLSIDQCPTNIYCFRNVWRVRPNHDCGLEPSPDTGGR